MKSTITLGIALAAGTLGSLGAAPQALAVLFTNTSGTICKNYNEGEANFIDYFVYGTRSSKIGTTQVICPLSRDTQNGNGAYLHVDIRHFSNATTTCTAYSHGYEGNLLASRSEKWTGTGVKELDIDLRGDGKSDLYSDYSLLCDIPGSYQGLIMGVDLHEF